MPIGASFMACTAYVPTVSPMRRPFGVTLVAALVLLSAVFNIVFGVWMMLAPFIDSPGLTDLTGNTQQLPVFYLVLNGLLSVVLGLMYFWLTKLTMVGSGTAYVLINFLSILNIFFGLFRLPYGWGIILLSALSLLLVNTSKARTWFQRTA